jgi:hypothetical protein
MGPDNAGRCQVTGYGLESWVPMLNVVITYWLISEMDHADGHAVLSIMLSCYEYCEINA